MKRYIHKQCVAFEPEMADKILALKDVLGSSLLKSLESVLSMTYHG